MKAANLPRLFSYSAGTLLLLAALGMFISVWAGAGMIHPPDPLFGMSLPMFFWIVAGIELSVALICLFGTRAALQVTLVLWLAINFAVCQAGLWWTGARGGFKGYLGDASSAFGISTSAADLTLKILVVYLFTGSVLSLLWPWIKKESGESPGSDLKISCPACGGHIRFAAQNLGQQIPCPHCEASVTLRRTDNLKMSCFFCQGHIEFPAHATGTKMACPHCKMDITLKESAQLQS